MEYIAFDVHKHYTWATVEDELAGSKGKERFHTHEACYRNSSKVVSLVLLLLWRRWETGTGLLMKSNLQGLAPSLYMQAKQSS